MVKYTQQGDPALHMPRVIPTTAGHILLNHVQSCAIRARRVILAFFAMDVLYAEVNFLTTKAENLQYNPRIRQIVRSIMGQGQLRIMCRKA